MEESYGGKGLKWLIGYSPTIKKDVQIGYYYRGVALDAISTSTFRRLLNDAPKLIFFHKSTERYTESEKKLLLELSDILDNASDNQVSNEDKSFVPRFYLESLETLKLNSQPMFLIKGYFLTMDRKPSTYLYTLLFDRDPKTEYCHVEELFFQANSKELYDKYFPGFKKSLETIEFK